MRVELTFCVAPRCVQITGGYINNELPPSFLSIDKYYMFLLNDVKSEVCSRTCAGCLPLLPL